MDIDQLKQKIDEINQSSKKLRAEREIAFSQHMASRPSGENKQNWASNFYKTENENFPEYSSATNEIANLQSQINALIKKDASKQRKDAILPLRDAMSTHGDIINNAHKIKNINFKSLPIDLFNQANMTNTKNPALSLYKSPSYGKRQSSEYKLMMIAGRPAYARKSNHWGTFSTNIKDIDQAVNELGISQEEAIDRQMSDPFGRIGSRYHNWSLEGGDHNKKTSQAGYVYLDDLNPEDIRKQDGGGITAYHGSPHEFEQFDTSKIGTGEGAQAYGHGLYFAESEPTATEYRDRLSDRASSFQIENTVMPKWIINKIAQHPDRSAAINELRQDFMQRLAEAEEEQKSSHQPWLASGKISSAKDILMGLDKIEQGAKVPSTKGHMYEVHINAHPDHFLDWDKPLSEQSEYVQNVLKQHPNANRLFGNDVVKGELKEPTGQSILNRLLGSQKEKSEQLQNFGIKGIKYLDAGSRNVSPAFDPSYLERQITKNREEHKNAISDQHRQELDEDHQILLQRLEDAKKEKHLSRNYVVFDHNDVAIKRKYAEGGEVEYPLADGAEHLKEMPPQEFLDRSRQLEDTPEDKKLVKEFKKDIKKGHELDPLALYKSGKENGRHRATAAKELGVKKVPVHDYRKRNGGAIVDHALMIISKKA